MHFLVGLLLLISLHSYAADTTKLYNPKANVVKDVEQVLARAKKEKKNVLLQIGGNWCVWCYRLNSFIQTDSLLKHILNDNYVLYHLNYSKENKNLDYLKKLGYPQRFGFPVLEKGNGYDEEKVKSFLKNWAPGAFDEMLYKE